MRVAREELPKALAKWYDYTKWVLDRVDTFPKNQRFVLGTRLADGVLTVMETLAEAAYARGAAKVELLGQANRRIESVRWLIRIAKDRNLLSSAHRRCLARKTPSVRPEVCSTPIGLRLGSSSNRARDADA